ncbi:MAG: DUF512 domain-containing protein [Anaerolineae bacterium]|nr:DUF512 domain-containing protein [Anaerolineae bacterium]
MTAPRTEASRGGVVMRVLPGTLAWRLGLRPGDEVLAVNGQVVRDEIDFLFSVAEDEVRLEVRRGEERLSLEAERAYGEDVGVEFASPLFDGVRTCHNACPFCFLKGLPPGLRESLYLRDDDYRLSFLFGNFVTLTNLTEADWRRIAAQHLSPLYVSIHATDPEVRERCFGRRNLPDVLVQLGRLGDMGIQVHAQVVLVPGLNDGPHLERTLQDLEGHFPTVQSVSVVPVGLTRYSLRALRGYTAEEARDLLRYLRNWQRRAVERWGVRWVYASDEWYFLAGRPVPAAAHYGGFPQLENGVGLTRWWLDDWARFRARWRRRPRQAVPGRRVVLVCGVMIAPVLEKMAEWLREHAAADLVVRPVENRFFGPSVQVSGLLTGADVAEVLRGERADCFLLPRAMWGADGERTLDDWTVADLERELGAPVCVAGEVEDVARALWGEGGDGP